ncbi:hypothetical protein K466DRAFT_606760 [Polyporus arcularius HHB13444]|uniref:Uncharacterized protein n=1 Tax=Polyporus arcularius HHB13444 TaxID=1314778 RepID=A0A5C3NQ16_9APHY|nr:hypothetical protein K466DRAFT_606760 [Polyporus arcularius HHB13444]
MSSERDPLIPRTTSPEPLDVKPDTRRVGPMEISRTTRYGILAAIWVGTFLSSLNTTLVATCEALSG